jgi:hypothetical protein
MKLTCDAPIEYQLAEPPEGSLTPFVTHPFNKKLSRVTTEVKNVGKKEKEHVLTLDRAVVSASVRWEFGDGNKSRLS